MVMHVNSEQREYIQRRAFVLREDFIYQLGVMKKRGNSYAVLVHRDAPFHEGVAGMLAIQHLVKLGFSVDRELSTGQLRTHKLSWPHNAFPLKSEGSPHPAPRGERHAHEAPEAPSLTISVS